MPHVASDLKFHGLSSLQQQAARQAHTSASPTTTPFDSILDETTRPDPAPRSQRAAADDDNAPRAERGQRTKSADRTDRAAKSDDQAKPSGADAPAKADSSPDTAKTGATGAKTTDAKATDTKATDTKTADTGSADAIAGDKASDQSTTAGDISTADATQQLTDAKPADAAALEPVAVVIDPAAALAANIAPPDAKGESKAQNSTIAATAATAASDATKAGIAAAVAAATATEATAATATTAPTTAPSPATASKAATVATTAAATATVGQPNAVTADVSAEATVADAPSNALAALTAKPEKTDKADLKSDKKTEADKKATSAQTTFKPAATPDPDAAQTANDEPAKDTGAHARAEATANSHRGGAAGTANSAVTNDGNAVAATSKAPDLMPPPGLTVQTPAAVQATGAPTATMAPTTIVQSDSSEPAVPIAGVAFEITSKALSGRNKFDIRLDPPDLGRIHVHLDVDRDGNVITHMVADRTDTLDLLRKDTTGLERALQDAGLKTSDNSLQFSLRDQQANQQQRNGGGESAHVVIEDEQLAAIEPAQRNYARYNASTGGLDIRV